MRKLVKIVTRNQIPIISKMFHSVSCRNLMHYSKLDPILFCILHLPFMNFESRRSFGTACIACPKIIGIKVEKTSPKGFSASKCDEGNWIFSKSYDFFEKWFENFWIFFEIVLEFILEFFWRIFWEDFFWWKFLGDIFWEDLYGRKF